MGPVLRAIMRYVGYVVLMGAIAVVFTLLLFALHFTSILIPDQNSVAWSNFHVVEDVFKTSPFIGVFLATRSLFGRIAAGLVLTYFWIWPVVHWYWIGAPQ
ncbi:hypothetical protein JJB07_01740 [Tumebacillus sp. ITR2]|uniref:Uncharacterized protein n=1 Tax=Tumebacillus amylolyticus TaxID=2801339 RepID=A0ABS1J503_9BACL|nr:hypothetical protein [Tumebacillus amylolyticus]MBL0385356.1 hypothetical protein [Tumebacillus amylolyticus]